MVRNTVFVADVAEPDLFFGVKDLPDPMEMRVLLAISNTYIVTLYFQATLSTPPADFTNYTQNLGSVGSGASSMFAHIFNRGKPILTSGEYDETITYRINAYADSGYTNLYSTQTLSVNIHHFDHSDPSWTVIANDTFTGGYSGWSSFLTTIDPTIASADVNNRVVVSDHYISSPSALGNQRVTSGTGYSLGKGYNTLGYSKVRIVLHLRKTGSLALQISGKLKLNGLSSTLIPDSTWFRVAFAMAVSASENVYWQQSGPYSTNSGWLDDVWVIAK